MDWANPFFLSLAIDHAFPTTSHRLPCPRHTFQGGSLRTPSAFCSTIGFRPTPGLIPDMHRKSLLFSPLAVDGPMARTVDDAALLMSVLAREDKRDPLGWEGIVGEAFLPERLPRIELGGLRVGFSEDLGGRVAVDDAVREAFRANLGKLQSLFSAESGGIDVKLEQVFGLPEIPQKSDNVKSMHDVFSVLRAEHFLSNLAARKPENREKLAWPVESNIDIAEGYCGSFFSWFSKKLL